ncbi:MAG: hypothetical protein Q9196_002174, partial [Gyalolechia fulgens]
MVSCRSFLQHHVFLFSLLDLLLLLPSATHARPRSRPGLFKRQFPIETACNDIFNSEFGLFTAESAHNCLISTPFNATVATNFLSYYKDTLQFQSTLSYLSNPPPTYNQPSVDLLGGLDAIQQAVNRGAYTNEYDFEAAVQKLVYSTHDAHLILYAGALSVFTFGAPLSIVSLSSDGIALPKIFILDDVLEAGDPAKKALFEPSPIATINGVRTLDFLKDYAASNSFGTLEPHADYNQLMSNPANDIQGYLSAWEGSSPFWPGNEITFAFENGTGPLTLPWLATYTVPDDTPPITSADDFYQIFVRGRVPIVAASATAVATPEVSATPTVDPTSTADVSAAAATSAEPQATSWEYFPYPPNPITVQPNLGDGGVVTGYFLNDGVTAVLSIPSFDVNSESIISFSTAVGEFLRESKAAGKERIIIDLQRNGGGGDLLATDTFKQFFPSVDPFGGSRLRAHDAADVIGNTISNDFSSSNSSTQELYAGTAWAAGTFINADTGRNFSSWAELFGPHMYNGDYFTTTQRDNLSSVILDEAVGGIVVYGFGNRSATSPQPYDAKNIILLSDGTCSSACAHFVELMHYQAGVRTVVAGGLPEPGPMQMPSGSRGAESYSSFLLDSDITFAASINSTAASLLPQNRDVNRDIEFYIIYAGFNLRDAIRKNDSTPLQFQHFPADCRIFYTKETVYNFENLWNYVIDAMWRNPSLCIAGSAAPFEASTASNSPAALPAKLSERSLNNPTPVSVIESRDLEEEDEEDDEEDDEEVFDPISDSDLSKLEPRQVSTTCPICSNAREICAKVPLCSQGRQVFTLQCRAKCAGFPADCGPYDSCSSTQRGVAG